MIIGRYYSVGYAERKKRKNCMYGIGRRPGIVGDAYLTLLTKQRVRAHYRSKWQYGEVDIDEECSSRRDRNTESGLPIVDNGAEGNGRENMVPRVRVRGPRNRRR